MEENIKQQPTDIIKFAIVGPESTGKSTLASDLATFYKTVWTPEFARKYLQQKWDTEKQVCTIDDLAPIIWGQLQLENQSLNTANTFLFCDTSAIVTKVFSDLYYGYSEPLIEKAARKHKYELFFLTDVDVPWVKDDIRDRPDTRRESLQRFEQALTDNKKPFIILSGDQQARLKQSVDIIEKLQKAKTLGFNAHDFVQIYNHGLSIDVLERQLEVFRLGIPKTMLDRAATRGDGLIHLKDTDYTKYAASFDAAKAGLKLKKFVPASGAASRMFKFLNEFLNDYKREEETINAYINRTGATSLAVFLVGLEKFPFYEDVMLRLQKYYSNYSSWTADLRKYYFVKVMLSPKHFDYASKPKGILPFHDYDGHIATAIEEHLNESCLYCCADNKANLHFTVSENHRSGFEKILKSIKPGIEEKNSNTININFSYQRKETDTVAVTPENEPFRDEEGNLVFRPGGHGALIENLNSLDADIVFIKNVDNVIHNHIETIALYKKALAGILLELQAKIFEYLRILESNKVSEQSINQIVVFSNKKLNIALNDEFDKYTVENKISALKDILDRPLRVCGMVKNEGEPGGGPFWVVNRKGNVSLQIVESSQVDVSDQQQLAIMGSATHFNPVDLVCSLKDYNGNKFELSAFVDHKSGFIVEKNKGGKPLKAYELPGLWNGAMAKWITVFVEVPLITFNPVKTVNDLLKPAHQPM